MEAMPLESALKTKAISLEVRTPIPKATEVATVIEVVVVIMVVVLTTTSSSIVHLTTVEVLVVTGCTMAASMKEEATGTGSNVRVSTKVLVRSGHLVVLLSPQVMVDQERRRTMTSSTTENTSKSANFPPGLLRETNLERDEHLSGADGRDHRGVCLLDSSSAFKI